MMRKLKTVNKCLYTKIDMDKVIFSDEWKFTLDSDDVSKI